MEKKTNDLGQVAVLVSPGHGAGWFSWHGVEELLYDPHVVDMVLDEESYATIIDYCNEAYSKNQYYGGASDLQVVWLDPGTQFRIDEYDGYETLVFPGEERWLTV